MGRERQKKKNRSSIPKSKPKSNRTKAGKKRVNFLGNEIIKQNWYAQIEIFEDLEPGLTYLQQGPQTHTLSEL